MKKNFVSQWTLDTIDQSVRALLNGRAELFRELRCKIVLSLRVGKEAYRMWGRKGELCHGMRGELWHGTRDGMRRKLSGAG